MSETSDTRNYIVGRQFQHSLSPLFSGPGENAVSYFEVKRNALEDQQLLLLIHRPENCQDNFQVVWKNPAVEAHLIGSTCVAQRRPTPWVLLQEPQKKEIKRTLGTLDHWAGANPQRVQQQIDLLNFVTDSHQSDNFHHLLDWTNYPLIQMWIATSQLPAAEQTAIDSWTDKLFRSIQENPPTLANSDYASLPSTIYRASPQLEETTFQSFQKQHPPPNLNKEEIERWKQFFAMEQPFIDTLDLMSSELGSTPEQQVVEKLRGALLKKNPMIPSELFDKLLLAQTQWLTHRSAFIKQDQTRPLDVATDTIFFGLVFDFSPQTTRLWKDAILQKLVDPKATEKEMEALNATFIASAFPMLQIWEDNNSIKQTLTESEVEKWSDHLRGIFESTLVKQTLPEMLQQSPTPLVMRRVQAISKVDAKGFIDWKLVMADISAPEPTVVPSVAIPKTAVMQPTSTPILPPQNIAPPAPALSWMPMEVPLLGAIGILSGVGGTIYKHNATPYPNRNGAVIERSTMGMAGAALTSAMVLGAWSLWNRPQAEKYKGWILGGAAVAGAALGATKISAAIPGNPSLLPSANPGTADGHGGGSHNGNNNSTHTGGPGGNTVTPTSEGEDARHPTGKTGF